MLPSITSPENSKTNNSSPGTAAPSGAAQKTKLTASDLTAAQKAPVDFVNLYDVLQMPLQSDPKDLRKRISELYLDAQKNQDHRNPQKKIYYQQLYEIYLPQARHLLLDTKRRAEYDNFLQVYREDQDRSAQVEEVLAAHAAQEHSTAPQNPVATQVVTKAIEELMTPEELAAYRADMWRQWEEGLERSKGELAKLTFSPIELQQRAVARQDYMERVMLEVRKENQRMEEKRERERRLEQEKREEEQAKAREEELQRRRETQFDENVDGLIATAKTYGGAGAGGAALLTSLSLLYMLNAYFWLMPSHTMMNMVGGGLSLLLTGVVASKSATEAVKRVQARALPRKDVQRQAEALARVVLNEKRAQTGTVATKTKPSSDQMREEAEEMHQEVNLQARQLHRAAIDEIVAETTGYGRAFAVGDGILLLGFIIMYVIDSMLNGDGDYSLRPTATFLIWIVTCGAAAGLGFWLLQRTKQQTLETLRNRKD